MPKDEIENLDIEETKPLQFRIPISLHTEFKIYAAGKGMKMVDLFRLMFEEYKKNDPK